MDPKPDAHLLTAFHVAQAEATETGLVQNADP